MGGSTAVSVEASRSLRILHVVPSYLPAVRYGGPIYSVHHLCVALVQRGHQVDVATTSVDGPGDSDVALGLRVELDGVGVHYFPSRWLRRLYYAPLLSAWLRDRVAAYDVVHLHSVFLWPTLTAARAAHRAGVPYVVSPRGMLVRELIRARSRWLKMAWIALFERRTIRQAAAIHLTAEIELAALDELGLRGGGLATVIPNGVEVGVQVKSQTQASDPYVLVLGRISWKKRIERAIEAIALLPGIRLVVAGGDDEGLQARLQQIAISHGAAERVQFVGHVEGRKKRELLQGARALLMVSLTENYGNVVLEAMAVGTPAIVVPQIGAADAVRAASGGWVVDDCIDALRRQLARLLDHPDEAMAAGQRAAHWVRSEASWPAIAGRMSALYESLVPVGQAS
ncbi:MAG: glycosyltransferase [Pseudomonadota bacterium]|nr:glycosyltransferase [Pseudomonadota bacterium]